MKLPLRDEINEVRRTAESAQAAAILLSQLQACLAGNTNTLRIAKSIQKAEPERVALQVLATVQERYPHLSGLVESPEQMRGDASRIQKDGLLLQQALRYVRPLAVDQTELGERLHALQHKQAHLLEQPTYSDALLELQEIETRRVAARERCAPLAQRRMRLQSATNILTTLLAQLDTALGGTDEVAELRLIAICESVYTTLSTVVTSLELAVEIKRPPRVNAPLSLGARMAIESYVAGLEELNDRICDALEEVATSHEEADLMRRRAVEELLERMG